MTPIPRRAFVTGSYAYGQPTEKSDLDIVILVTRGECDLIDLAFKSFHPYSATERMADYGGHSVQRLFDRLNLIICVDAQTYEIWWKGTQQLIKHRNKTGKPVSRATACKHFKKLREKAK